MQDQQAPQAPDLPLLMQGRPGGHATVPSPTFLCSPCMDSSPQTIPYPKTETWDRGQSCPITRRLIIFKLLRNNIAMAAATEARKKSNMNIPNFTQNRPHINSTWLQVCPANLLFLGAQRQLCVLEEVPKYLKCGRQNDLSKRPMSQSPEPAKMLRYVIRKRGIIVEGELRLPAHGPWDTEVIPDYRSGSKIITRILKGTRGRQKWAKERGRDHRSIMRGCLVAGFEGRGRVGPQPWKVLKSQEPISP